MKQPLAFSGYRRRSTWKDPHTNSLTQRELNSSTQSVGDTVLWFNVLICRLCAREIVYPKIQYLAPGVWPSGGCVVCHAFCFLFWSEGTAVLRHRPPFQIGFECFNEFISHCWFPAVKLRSLLHISSHHVYMHTRNLVTKGYLVTREITWPGLPNSCVWKHQIGNVIW